VAKYTQELFEEIWRYREEEIYPKLFGVAEAGISPIPFERLQTGKITDPRWSTCGVFRFAPTADRDSWLYATSGLSNEWFEEEFSPENVSGLGCEFVLETTERADWPIHRLHELMTFQIGLCCDLYDGAPPLAYGDRVPLGGSIDYLKSALSHATIIEAISFPSEFQQESGVADWFQVVGITNAEKLYAKEHGPDALVDLLVQRTKYPQTDPLRESLL
jgi:Suppressor of fused protein (SUFU)